MLQFRKDACEHEEWIRTPGSYQIVKLTNAVVWTRQHVKYDLRTSMRTDGLSAS